MTYPWNPWYNDPLEYPLRCLEPWLSSISSAGQYGLFRTDTEMKRKTHVWFQTIDFLTISYPYLLLAEVLMVSLGLTMFISTLYGHFFSYWDSSIGLGPWETVADNEPEMSTSMQGVEMCGIRKAPEELGYPLEVSRRHGTFPGTLGNR